MRILSQLSCPFTLEAVFSLSPAAARAPGERGGWLSWLWRRPSNWRKRRWVGTWACLVGVALAGALGVALVRSDTSQVVLYNDCEETLGPMELKACGQSTLLSGIEGHTSIRVRLKELGSESAVELTMAAGEWHWEGAYVEPRGGYVVVLHVLPGLEVESSEQVSFWRQFLRETF